MPAPRGLPVSFHVPSPDELAAQGAGGLWRAPEVVGSGNPYYQQDRTGGDNVISLSDIDGSKAPSYKPIIDRSAMVTNDTHWEAPAPHSPYSYNGPENRAQILQTSAPDGSQKSPRVSNNNTIVDAINNIFNPAPSTGNGLSATGEAFIKDGEKLRLTAYDDGYGNLTIGWGHTGNDVKAGQKITKAQAQALFDRDITHVTNAIARNVKTPISQSQFDALVSFGFNTGTGTIPKIAKKINAGDLDGALARMGKYVRAGGSVSKGLQNRRAAEAALWGGNWGSTAVAATDTSNKMSRSQIKSLQHAINATGYTTADGGKPLAEDGKWGPQTEKATKLVAATARALNANSSPEHIAAVQASLRAQGVTGENGKPLKVDGKWGPQTASAVSSYSTNTAVASRKSTGPLNTAVANAAPKVGRYDSAANAYTGFAPTTSLPAQEAITNAVGIARRPNALTAADMEAPFMNAGQAEGSIHGIPVKQIEAGLKAAGYPAVVDGKLSQAELNAANAYRAADQNRDAPPARVAPSVPGARPVAATGNTIASAPRSVPATGNTFASSPRPVAATGNIAPSAPRPVAATGLTSSTGGASMTNTGVNPTLADIHDRRESAAPQPKSAWESGPYGAGSNVTVAPSNRAAMGAAVDPRWSGSDGGRILMEAMREANRIAATPKISQADIDREQRTQEARAPLSVGLSRMLSTPKGGDKTSSTMKPGISLASYSAPSVSRYSAPSKSPLDSLGRANPAPSVAPSVAAKPKTTTSTGGILSSPMGILTTAPANERLSALLSTPVSGANSKLLDIHDKRETAPGIVPKPVPTVTIGKPGAFTKPAVTTQLPASIKPTPVATTSFKTVPASTVSLPDIAAAPPPAAVKPPAQKDTPAKTFLDSLRKNSGDIGGLGIAMKGMPDVTRDRIVAIIQSLPTETRASVLKGDVSNVPAGVMASLNAALSNATAPASAKAPNAAAQNASNIYNYGVSGTYVGGAPSNAGSSSSSGTAGNGSGGGGYVGGTYNSGSTGGANIGSGIGGAFRNK